MRGHIRKRGNTYSIILEIGEDLTTGKRKQKWISGFKSKKEAEKELAKKINEIETGQYIENKNMKLGEFLQNWLDNIKHNIEEGTYVFYKDIVERVLIPSLGKTSIEKLKPLQIQSFLSSKIEDNQLSSTTVRHYYNVLNIALNQAIKWQIINKNPCTLVDPPKAMKAKIVLYTPEQVLKLLNYTKTSEYNAMYIHILLAVSCGLRRGEVLGLQWDDVDFNKLTIRIKNNVVKVGNEVKIKTPKTDLSLRTVALPPSIAEALNKHKKTQDKHKLSLGIEYCNNNFVCTWPNGNTIKPDYVTHTLKKILNKCSLPDIRFHDLRHIHATLLLLEGVNPKIVSERLGHGNISITLDTYTHVLPQMQEEAALKLDNSIFKKSK